VRRPRGRDPQPLRLPRPTQAPVPIIRTKHESSRILDLRLASVETPDSKTHTSWKSTAQRSISSLCVFLKAPPRTRGGVGEGCWQSLNTWFRREYKIRDDSCL